MITQGPFDLTLNTALPLNDPGANSNNAATAVQIQNSSGFVIEVNAGGILLTIQSFAAQTVPTSGGGQQMSVTPISANNPGQTTDPTSLTVVWLLAGETAPMLDGPLTASAIAQGLANAGISGVAIKAASVSVASGATGSVTLGHFQLWSWGFNGDPGWPTLGGVQAAIGTAGASALDSLGWTQGGSNRLTGLRASGDIKFSNKTDVSLILFADYSAS